MGDLFERQVATLAASWRAYARHSDGARVADVEGAAVGLFPSPPERGVYNNALLPRGLGSLRSRPAVCASIPPRGRWRCRSTSSRHRGHGSSSATSIGTDTGSSRGCRLLRGASAAEFNLRVARLDGHDIGAVIG